LIENIENSALLPAQLTVLIKSLHSASIS